MWPAPTRPRAADGTIEAEMAHRIVILGGGTGGTLAANRLRRLYRDGAEIVVVDRDDRHVYRPGLLFVPFGLADPERLVRSRRAQLLDGIELRPAEVEQVDTAGSTVELAGGETLAYDALVIAAGAELQPAETEGLSFGDRVHTFYTLDGAVALRSALGRLERGCLVVNLVDLPITCPVAPLEFCFLADSYLRRRSIRDQVELTFATPLDAAFTKPVAAERLSGLLARKGIRVETEFATGRVDGEAGVLSSWDERELPFDLLVTIPLHGGPAFVGRSPGLGDELGFVDADPATLQAKAAPNVFAIGDAANLPISKAGSAAHFQGDTLVTNVRRHLAGEPLVASYDGHVNCFVETGDRKALLLDFDYEHEPLPGRFGPLPLLRESRANHLAKVAFQWLYWHLLLPGRELPGIARRHGGTT
jgi:sulfide:quinone oxidoreductase